MFIFFSFVRSEKKYSLVLEYADNTLESYLAKHFSELSWSNKYRLAFQLANAVAYLHEREIIHRDPVMHFIFV